MLELSHKENEIFLKICGKKKVILEKNTYFYLKIKNLKIKISSLEKMQNILNETWLYYERLVKIMKIGNKNVF